VVLWTPETTFAEVARIAVAPPPDLRSSFRPTYNLAVNLVRHFDRETALQVLRRSFAQWQANANPARGGRDLLAEHLGRRLAVLEELGYVRAWSLTEPGRQLAGIYHEADLLLAEAVTSGVLDDTEPAVLAGVLSSLVFERRRAKKPSPTRHAATAPTGGPRSARPRRRRGRPGTGWASSGAPSSQTASVCWSPERSASGAPRRSTSYRGRAPPRSASPGR